VAIKFPIVRFFWAAVARAHLRCCAWFTVAARVHVLFHRHIIATTSWWIKIYIIISDIDSVRNSDPTLIRFTDIISSNQRGRYLWININCARGAVSVGVLSSGGVSVCLSVCLCMWLNNFRRARAAWPCDVSGDTHSVELRTARVTPVTSNWQCCVCGGVGDTAIGCVN